MKFDSLKKMRITSSDPKHHLVRSGKMLITSICLKSKSRSNKYKKARYAIVNFSMKDPSKIIRNFENISYKGYERKRPKHEPTGSYFYLARQIVKCMMRSDLLKPDNCPVRMLMTDTQQIPISHICSTDES